MDRKKKRKIKRRILLTIIYIDWAVFMFAICSIDTPGWFFTILALITGAWLALFLYANGYMK